MKNTIAFFFAIYFFSPCISQQLIDKNATKETVALYKNIFTLSSKGVMFGHQDDESYGVWRNANKKHHYASYKGHPSEADFKKFYDDPYTLFEVDLKNLYK
jgi:hypothetical protein